MTENELQNAVMDAAKLYGWIVHHGRPVKDHRGRWSTPIQGTPGFPDLVLARDGRVLFVELKSASGRLTETQRLWLQMLPHSHVWRPIDWHSDLILKMLK